MNTAQTVLYFVENKDFCPKCNKAWDEHEFAVPSPHCPISLEDKFKINGAYAFIKGDLEGIPFPNPRQECRHKFVDNGVSGAAICSICGHRPGYWFCPSSPFSDKQCSYSESYDECDYCHEPEERK